ncbi:MAG: flagellar biosynthetic protein FliO [Spirochaetes bacterium]|nr:flagellar biosynthetic protein FliO [Spirochaetota bacterium]
MNKTSIHFVTRAILIIFSFSAVVCPLDALAKKTKREAKREMAKQEEKAVVDPAGEKREPEEGDLAESKERGAAGEEAAVPGGNYKEEDFKPQVEEESAVWMFIKMLLILGIFAGGFYYFYRFVTKKAGISIFGGEAIKVLSVVPLGQNKFLQVVDLAGRILVVGVSDNAINLITEITEKDQIDRIRILSTRTPPSARGAGGFQDHVVKEIGKLISRVREARRGDAVHRAAEMERPSDINYLRQQRSRLKNMNGLEND